MPRRKTRTARTKRDYLLPEELDRLLDAALDSGRHAHRNYTLILMGFRHGLTPGSLMHLRWKMVDLKRKTLTLPRSGKGPNYPHPLSGLETRALRKLKRDYPNTPYLFVTSSGNTLTERSLSRIISEAGEAAGFRFHLRPRMLRHGCGHALAEAGQNIASIQHYLGLSDFRRVQRYVELPADPYKGFWKS